MKTKTKVCPYCKGTGRVSAAEYDKLIEEALKAYKIPSPKLTPGIGSRMSRMLDDKGFERYPSETTAKKVLEDLQAKINAAMNDKEEAI